MNVHMSLDNTEGIAVHPQRVLATALLAPGIVTVAARGSFKLDLFHWTNIPMPEPFASGPPEDLCVYTNTGKWGTNTRTTVAPFGLGAFNEFNDARGYEHFPNTNVWRNN